MSLEVCEDCIDKGRKLYKCSKCSATLCMHSFRTHKCGDPNLGLRAEKSERRNVDTSLESWKKESEKGFEVELRDDLSFVVEYPYYPFTQLRAFVPAQRTSFKTEQQTRFSLDLYLRGEEQVDPEPIAYQRRFEHYKNWVRYQYNSFIRRWFDTSDYYEKESTQRTTKFVLEFPQFLEHDLEIFRKHNITLSASSAAQSKLEVLRSQPWEDFQVKVFPDVRSDELVVQWSPKTDQWFRPLVLVFVDYLTILYYESESQKSILPTLTQSDARELRVPFWAIFRGMEFFESLREVLSSQKESEQPVKLHFERYKPRSVPWSHSENARAQFKLRPYQQDALDAWKERHYFGSEELPTGAGKTVIGIGAIWETKERTLILVPNLDLVDQWRDRVVTFLGISPSQVGVFSGVRKDFEKDIVISTYQLLSQYIQDFVAGGEEDETFGDEPSSKPRRDRGKVQRAVHYFRSQFGLLLADECHHVQAKTFKEIALNLDIPKRLALSATIDWDLNTSLILATMGPKIYGITYGTLSKQGYIPPIIYRKIDVPLTGKEMDSLATKKGKTQGFRSKLCREAENKYPILTRIINEPFTEQVLIFTSRISHAEAIQKHLKKEEIPSTLLVGTTVTNAREREQILQNFREKRIHILILVKMLNEGFDAPADTVIIVSGSRNKREMVQRCGRTTRLGHIAKIFELVVDKDDLDTEHEIATARDIRNVIEPWIQDKLVSKALLKQVNALVQNPLKAITAPAT